LGTSYTKRGPTPDTAESYVVFGRTTGFDSSIDLFSLDGTNGFKLKDSGGPDQSLHSVSNAGDLNHDGIDDIIIGVPNATVNGNNSAGKSYVVFGSSSGFNSEFELSFLNGTNGFIIHGTHIGDGSGHAVSSAHDINNDGIDDIIIAKRFSGAYESYVIYGNSNGFNSHLDLSSLNGENGFVLNGHNAASVSGSDDINGDGISDLIVGSHSPFQNEGDWIGQSFVVFGQNDPLPGDDVIDGVAGDNTIDAGGGNDVVRSQSGSDTIDGGTGSDRIYANGGNDNVLGGHGNDTIHGGDGNDTLEGGLNDDILDGGTGDDLISGGNGNDILLGYADHDRLNGGAGDDKLFGHGGIDQIYGGEGNDNLYGGSGDDTLNGNNGDDKVYGGEGDDSVSGGIGNDWLFGNADNDTLNGDGGDDFLYGGGGDDTIDGGTGNDFIFAQAGNDTAIGGAGNDVIYGGAGDDTLIGGGLSNASFAGQVDRLYGGSGSDTYVIENRYEADADRDLAIIRGFNKAEDTIQLSSDTHTLANVQTGTGLYATSGTGIYNSSGDLLAVIESHVVGSLDLQASYFVVA
ncbi:MAG: hypothetical protein AAFO84_09875, partial [Cyanobacteria bacterium J06598_1]